MPAPAESKTIEDRAVTTITIAKTDRRDDRAHTEEGFFRRLINRSGRRNRKEREAESDCSDAPATKLLVKPEPKKPVIKKGVDLSIMDVLSKVRAHDSTTSGKSCKSADKMAKVEKLKSGPESRQRFSPKNISVSKEFIAAEIANSQVDRHDSKRSATRRNGSPLLSRADPGISFVSITSPMQSTSLRFSTDQTDSHALQCRSDEMLNSNKPHHTSADMLMSRIGEADPMTPRNYWSPSNDWNKRQQYYSKVTFVDRNHSAARGKLVEKSKSFRLYTKNYGGGAPPSRVSSNEPFKPFVSVANMPSLPDLTLSDKYSRHSDSNGDSMYSLRFLSSRGGVNDGFDEWSPRRSAEFHREPTRDQIDEGQNQTTMACSTTSDEISSLELDRSISAADEGNHGSILPLSISKTPIRQNINEIEDNIDKMLKSPFVTVLKKSPTSDLNHIKTSSPNISFTTITSARPDSTRARSLNFASVENPPLLRHSMTATKLEIRTPASPQPKKTATSSENMPEFMNIQLNRIDSSRPKSCIEYSSRISTNSSSATPPVPKSNSVGENDEEKERRFSNESIEISDKKRVLSLSANLPATPEKLSDPSRGLFNRSSRVYNYESTLSREDLTIGLKESNSVDSALSSDDCFEADASGSDDSGEVPPSALITRRKSVSDKKLKFEKKIEELQAEVKRSSIVIVDKSAANKPPSDDTPVTMRNKKPTIMSTTTSSSKSGDDSDSTPELMKVFARRSLKIKDTDEYKCHDDSESAALSRKMNASVDNANNNVSGGKTAADSDKENQVGSGGGNGGKDDKSHVSKVEIHIQTSPNIEFDIREKAEIFKRDIKSEPITDKRKSLIGSNKANHFSNNYRGSSAFFDHRNNVNKKETETDDNADNLNAKSPSNNNMQNNVNQNRKLKLINSTAEADASADSAPNDNQNKANANVSDNGSDHETEFKGILERKAEWEKRAQQASK